MELNGLSRRDFLKAVAAGSVTGIAAAIVPLSASVAAQEMSFNEAPMLADLVSAGSLPPVAERIPSNPRVITPYNEIGEYGGTWRRAHKGLSDRWGPTKLNEEMIIEWYAPDPDSLELVANYISEWSQNEDATEFTFTLRDGLHWSDGAPFTTTDVQFYYDLASTDPPVRNPEGHFVVAGELMELEIVDELTWTIRFAAPNPLLPITLARTASGHDAGPAMAMPKHYLEQYWGDSPNANQDVINAALETNGLDSWQQLWPETGNGQGPITSWHQNPNVPVITAWRSFTTPIEDPYIMERNPYYHAVDTEGNQLPYIDRINHAFFESNETLNLWIAQGLIDMQTRHLSVADFTYYKENEEAGDYTVVLWKAAWTHAFHPNISNPNTALAALFDTADFRHALSIAINRQEINDLVFNGLLEPRQAAPVSGSLGFDPDFETRWTEYDPDQANALLDGIGMTERDADGWRTYPNGDPLTFRITYTNAGFDGGADEVGLVQGYWQAIGLNVQQEIVERSLYTERFQAGDIEVGVWNVDRSAVPMADPGRLLGTTDDGTWATNYAHWLAANVLGQTVIGTQTEPPADHPIRRIFDLWIQVRSEPDETTRAELFQEILNIHKEHPYMIGTLGEDPVPVVVKNNFFNVNAGFIYDDALRSQGLIMPAQFFMRQ
jgi:peptide/nickel transport system substrate-binding protein